MNLGNKFSLFSRKYIYIYLLLGVILSVVVISKSSLAYLTRDVEGNDNTYTTGELGLTISEDNPISITNALPMTDAEGASLTPNTITITNTGTVAQTFDIYLNITSDSSGIDPNYLKVKVGTNNIIVPASNDYKIKEGVTLGAGKSKKIKIRLWLDENVPVSQKNKTLTAKISTKGYSDKEPNLLNEYLKNLILGSNSLPALSSGAESYTQTTSSTVVIHHPATTETIEGYSYRYTGSSPYNYITFNNELWRIIGVEQVQLSDGSYEYLTKIIRNSLIGSFSWDNKNIETGAEDNYGKNDWTTARLMKTLNPGYEDNDEDSDGTKEGNSLYWNRASGTCYYGQNNAEVSCNFTNTGLTTSSWDYIENVKWKIGGFSSYSQLAKALYLLQNGNTVFTGRPTSWVGKVGLMQIHDYGYAAGSSCFSGTSLSSYSSSCYNSDWLYSSNSQWTLSPYYGNSNYNAYIYSSPSTTNSYSTLGVRPVIYLKYDTILSGGSGKSNDPYTISITLD